LINDSNGLPVSQCLEASLALSELASDFYCTCADKTGINTNTALDDSSVVVQLNRFIITTNTSATINCNNQS
jgi:hypothetical protein